MNRRFLDLSSFEQAAALRLDSHLAHRSGILCLMEGDDRQARLRFGPQVFQAPARVRPALEFIRDHPLFAVAEIPGLDDASKLLLSRRLIHDGLLRLNPT